MGFRSWLRVRQCQKSINIYPHVTRIAGCDRHEPVVPLNITPKWQRKDCVERIERHNVNDKGVSIEQGYLCNIGDNFCNPVESKIADAACKLGSSVEEKP